MLKSHRATLIISLLASLESRASTRDVDVILSVFGLPTPDRDGYDGPSYQDILLGANDQSLIEIAEFLGVSLPDTLANTADSGIWTSGGLRVFISHVSTKKQVAMSLASELSKYGIRAFVAHEDIEPSKEWQVEILRALHSCHATVILLSDGFRESAWCDQELGIALGRRLPLVPLIYDTLPHGFAGAIQGIPVKGKRLGDVVPHIVETLLSNGTTDRDTADSLVTKLATISDLSHAEMLAALLPRISRISESAASQLASALHDNKILANSASVLKAAQSVLKRLGHPLATKAVGRRVFDDDIPF